MNNLNDLVEKYVESVIIHGKESWGSDYKKANRHYKIYTKCFIDICKYKKEGEIALRQLLNHSSHFVRYAAAYHLLPFDREMGLKMLKKCKNEPDGVGFNVKITISEWKNGDLRFPFEKDGKIISMTIDDFMDAQNQQ